MAARLTDTWRRVCDRSGAVARRAVRRGTVRRIETILLDITFSCARRLHLGTNALRAHERRVKELTDGALSSYRDLPRTACLSPERAAVTDRHRTHINTLHLAQLSRRAHGECDKLLRRRNLFGTNICKRRAPTRVGIVFCRPRGRQVPLAPAVEGTFNGDQVAMQLQLVVLQRNQSCHQHALLLLEPEPLFRSQHLFLHVAVSMSRGDHDVTSTCITIIFIRK